MKRSSFRATDRLVVAGFAAAMAVLLGVMTYARAQVARVDAAMERVERTHRVLETVAEARTRLAETQAEQRGYLLARDAGDLAAYRHAAHRADSALARLRTLTADDPAQRRGADSMQALTRRLVTELDAVATEAGGAAGATAAARHVGATTMAELTALSDRITAEQRARLVIRAASYVAERRAARRTVLLGAIAVFLVTLVAALRVRAALAVRARAERERDEHARALELQSQEVVAQNEELIAQGEALQLAMDQAESANHTKSMFLAQMSHELRTPLNSVIGFANILRRNPRGALNAAEVNYLDRIVENGRQLLRTINSILDLSKIEAEQESVELELVSLDGLVREVLAQLEPQAAAGQVELAGDLPSPLASVVTDSEKLRRVLINLVANAVKFTRQGGRVLVRVETAPRERTMPVAIEVRDTGIGIAPERLAMIFEAFEQGDVGVGREYGGTGLGLSISRALCRLLHCDLTVSSALGRGSVFRVALPLAGALASLPTDARRAADGAGV